jgi:hypothetical protein
MRYLFRLRVQLALHSRRVVQRGFLSSHRHCAAQAALRCTLRCTPPHPTAAFIGNICRYKITAVHPFLIFIVMPLSPFVVQPKNPTAVDADVHVCGDGRVVVKASSTFLHDRMKTATQLPCTAGGDYCIPSNSPFEPSLTLVS